MRLFVEYMLYDFRSILRSPGQSFLIVFTLALGIGFNVGIFSIFYQALVRPLPVPEPDRLVNLAAPGPKSGTTSITQIGDSTQVFSYPLFRDLTEEQSVFTDLAAHHNFYVNLAHAGQTDTGDGLLVSGSYFRVLGLNPEVGRLIEPFDDTGPGSERVAVLSHAYWINSFGGDTGVLNQTLVVNGQPLTIVGVAPAGFDGTTQASSPKVFVPISLRWDLISDKDSDPTDRSYHWVYLFGRLRDSISSEQAQSALTVLFRNILKQVEAPLQRDMDEAALEQFRQREIVLLPGSRGQSAWHSIVRLPLILLLAISGLVLIVACANVTNLMLAQATKRTSEYAVRVALGANRSHLFAQVLINAAILAIFGALAGVAFGFLTVKAILALLPAEVSRFLTAEINLPMMLFALALGSASVILFGLVPAIRSTAVDSGALLKADSASIVEGKGSARARIVLVTTQIGLSMVLVVVGALFAQSLWQLSAPDLGIEIEQLISFSVSPSRNGYSDENALLLYERLEEELRALPEVEDVGLSSVPILIGAGSEARISLEGRDAPLASEQAVRRLDVSPGFFSTVGVSLLAGRVFDRTDMAEHAATVIVNEQIARRLQAPPNELLGKYLVLESGTRQRLQVVGVVEDAIIIHPKRTSAAPIIFMPYFQIGHPGAMSFNVRAAGDAKTLLSQIRRVVGRIDRNLPVEHLLTKREQLRRDVLFLDYAMAQLSLAFAILAVLLATVGLFGVISYTVAQRTGEIGLRMALGASHGRIFAMVLAYIAVPVAIGCMIGGVLSLVVGRSVQAMLYGVSPQSPAIYLLATILLLALAALASYLPARRAARIQPTQALRFQ